MRCAILAPIACLALGGCSLYTFEREWGVSVSTDAYPTPAAQQAAVAEKWSHFRPDLRACVAADDPAHLADLDQGRSYRIDGWFLDRERTGAVIACMQRKGYSVTGPAL